jgi:hypothetical protein
MPRLGRCHLGPVFAGEGRPLGRRFRREPQLHRRQARREIREPNVVPVLLPELGLRHATRGAADCTDSDSLVALPRSSQSNDSHTHRLRDFTGSLASQAKHRQHRHYQQAPRENAVESAGDPKGNGRSLPVNHSRPTDHRKHHPLLDAQHPERRRNGAKDDASQVSAHGYKRFLRSAPEPSAIGGTPQHKFSVHRMPVARDHA